MLSAHDREEGTAASHLPRHSIRAFSPFNVGRLAGRLTLIVSIAVAYGCGGPSHGTLALGGRNGSVSISFAEKKSLENLEANAAINHPAGQTCISSESPYYSVVSGLAEQISVTLASRSDLSPPVRRVELLENPPRSEDSIAVFLCGGMSADAETLYRTVRLSNSFMDKLKEASSIAGGDDLFLSALGFVLSHEIGHAALNHSAVKIRGNDTAFDLPREIEADQFAYDFLTSSGIGTKGIELARGAARTEADAGDKQ